MNIILYLLQIIQYLYQQNCWLINFICRYIPLKQWAFDDSHSPKYQKFKIDKLPVIKTFMKQDWQFLLEYYQWKYGKPVKPVQRRNGKSILEDTVCPLCGAPHHFIYDNNGGNGQFQCKVCGRTFCPVKSLRHPSVLSVLTVAIPLPQRKTAGFSAYINVSIQSVLTISTPLKKWSRKTLMRTMAKTNINSITSTVNSPWISLPCPVSLPESPPAHELS